MKKKPTMFIELLYFLAEKISSWHNNRFDDQDDGADDEENQKWEETGSLKYKTSVAVFYFCHIIT